MLASLSAQVVWLIFLLIDVRFTIPTLTGPSSGPTYQGDHPDGFWIGTQSIVCMSGKTGFPPIMKRSITDAHQRTGFRYIHRLLFYSGVVFEWGTGVRGYHFGPSASVFECPVEWEQQPAGYSNCSIEVLSRFSRNYRRDYGYYNLLVNNCHHFVNRAALVLTNYNCSLESRPAQGKQGSDAVVHWAAKKLWRAVDFVLSYLPDRK